MRSVQCYGCEVRGGKVFREVEQVPGRAPDAEDCDENQDRDPRNVH